MGAHLYTHALRFYDLNQPYWYMKLKENYQNKGFILIISRNTYETQKWYCPVAGTMRIHVFTDDDEWQTTHDLAYHLKRQKYIHSNSFKIEFLFY
jgi:hypothetical protein